MATVLQADISHLDRLAKRFSTEARAVVLSVVALIITVLALLMAFMALSDAKDARVRAELQDAKISELADDIDVYRIRLAKLNAWLAARGIPTEEIYDDF